MTRGAAAIGLYLVAVGVGHIALAVNWSEKTVGLPRDGQAFTGTMLLGAGVVVLGIFATVVSLKYERTVGGFVLGSFPALVVAAAVVGYTASRGYLIRALPGGSPCVVEGGRTFCGPGDGTYIADAQPDLVVIFLGTFVAYALANVTGRIAQRRVALNPAR